MLALLRMPFLYALFLGVVISYLQIPVPPLLLSTYSLAKSAFVVVAMVIMGGMVNKFNVLHINWSVLRAVLAIRYIAWPLAIGAVLLLDGTTNFLLPEVRVVLACNAFVPVALNSVNLSLVMGIESGEAANMVVISTILSFLLVPIVVLTF